MTLIDCNVFIDTISAMLAKQQTTLDTVPSGKTSRQLRE